MPKPTLKSIYEKHGLTRDQFNAIRAKGVNVYNDDELKAAIKGQRHRLPDDAKLHGNSKAGKAQTLEEIEKAIYESKDIETIKMLKVKLDALKVAVAIRRELRELIDRGEVKEGVVKAFSITRSRLLKLPSDLPPRTSGLPEAKMQPIIRNEIIEILTDLSEGLDKLYV